jgi:HPt (histidine-containing phosphotransfer) domain-containing protein
MISSDLVTRGVATGLLKSRGHEVQIAANLSPLGEQPPTPLPDVLLLDVSLEDPELEDALAALRLAADNEDRVLRVVVVQHATDQAETPSAASIQADARIKKPFRPADLYAAIQPPPLPVSEAPASDAGVQLFDWDKAVEHMEGREELLKELVASFLVECENLKKLIRDAFASQDQVALTRGAHTLKGNASMFQASPTVAAAKQLEMLAKEGRWEEAQDAWSRLQTHVDRLLPALSSHASK